MDGQTLFDGSSRAGGCGGCDGRAVVQPGGGAVRGGDQHGDQLGAAVARDRQRCAGQDGRSQAEGDCGRASRLAAAADQGRRLHLARAGGRARRARAEGRLPLGVGVRPRREAQLQKKAWWPASTIVPTSRGGGRNGQSIRTGSTPERLVFIDETWTKTNMAPLRGWAPRGKRLRRPRCRTATGRRMTFLAALRHDRIDAPWLLDGPINGESFRAYVEQVLVPDAQARRHRHHGQSRQPQGQGRAPRSSARPAPSSSSCPNTRPTSIRSSRSSPSSSTCCARPPRAPSRPSAPQSAKFFRAFTADDNGANVRRPTPATR